MKLRKFESSDSETSDQISIPRLAFGVTQLKVHSQKRLVDASINKLMFDKLTTQSQTKETGVKCPSSGNLLAWKFTIHDTGILPELEY